MTCKTDPTPGHFRCTCVEPHQGDHYCGLCKSGYPRTYEEHTGSRKHRDLIAASQNRRSPWTSTDAN